MKEKIQQLLSLCKELNKYAHKLTAEDLRQYQPDGLLVPMDLQTVQQVTNEVRARLERGCKPIENKVILHTGPHHDDIMLGLMPLINRQLRPVSNEVYFNVMTSGYHSVSNSFMREALADTLRFLNAGLIEMVRYPDFFSGGYLLKYDKDVHHYLDNVAKKDSQGMRRGLCHRILRDIVRIWKTRSVEETRSVLLRELENLSADAPVETPEMDRLKGLEREFEEELVWAYMGVPGRNVRHLHLGLYSRQEETFTPDLQSDILPILEQLRLIRPDIISVVMDTGGLRPDTHYKVLRSVAEAVRLRNEEADLSHVRILAYRNVWSTFHPADANTYVPVSLNAFAVIEKAFKSSYLSQFKAEFPNPNFDGPFSELAESIWVRQLRDIQLLLGKDFFYQNKSALIRATHGLLFLNDLSVGEFLELVN